MATQGEVRLGSASPYPLQVYNGSWQDIYGRLIHSGAPTLGDGEVGYTTIDGEPSVVWKVGSNVFYRPYSTAGSSTSAPAGAVRFLTSTNELEVSNGSNWMGEADIIQLSVDKGEGGTYTVGERIYISYQGGTGVNGKDVIIYTVRPDGKASSIMPNRFDSGDTFDGTLVSIPPAEGGYVFNVSAPEGVHSLVIEAWDNVVWNGEDPVADYAYPDDFILTGFRGSKTTWFEVVRS